MVCVGVLLGAFLTLPSSAPPRAVSHPLGPGSAPPGVLVHAQVVPDYALLEAGQSVDLRLSAIPAATGCVVQPNAISWEPEPTPAPAGFLNATTGPVVNFTSYPTADNTAVIQVELEGEVLCPGGNSSFGDSATAGLTVLPALALSSWDGPTVPVSPGTPVHLWGTASGGCPPYEATIDFGDGNRSTISVPTSGPFSVVHLYGTGSYFPTLEVVDSLGVGRSTVVANPILVADDLVAGIVVPNRLVDPGVPVDLSVVVTGGFPPYTDLWNDSEGNAGVGPNWTMPPLLPGPDHVTLRIEDRLGDSIESERLVDVAAPLEAEATPTAAGGDVGRPVGARIVLSGGVPPYDLIGIAEPSGSSFEFRTPVAGDFATAVVPATDSPLWLALNVTDSDGAILSGQYYLGAVHAPPYLITNLTPATGEVGGSLHLDGLAIGGTPPLNWTLATTAALSSSSPEQGSLPSAGAFDWMGTPRAPGTAWFVTTLVDAAGAAITENLSIRIAPALAAGLLLPASPGLAGRPVNLTATIRGGVPPYRWSFSLSDGELLSGGSNQSGPVQSTASPRDPGDLGVAFSVTDATGAVVVAPNGTVAIGAAPAAPNPPPGEGTGTPPSSAAEGSWVPWVALPAFLLLALWLYLHRRAPARGSSVSSGESALSVIRRLLKDGEENDEETLLLLAEEEGISAEQARRALHRWVAARRVASEELGEGIVAYRWQDRLDAGAASVPDEGTEASP
jgi:hypothetical protein